jgi:hypothetical protein
LERIFLNGYWKVRKIRKLRGFVFFKDKFKKGFKIEALLKRKIVFLKKIKSIVEKKIAYITVL